MRGEELFRAAGNFFSARGGLPLAHRRRRRGVYLLFSAEILRFANKMASPQNRERGVGRSCAAKNFSVSPATSFQAADFT